MIDRQPFGKTGHQSTRIIFGSYALSSATQKKADQVLEMLLQYGINHIDTAPMYGNAEKCIGNWMGKHRGEFFIATKTRSRSRAGAWKNLQQSLKLLQVDSIDLWQMHGLTNPQGWAKAMGPGGALEAFLEAREKGLVKALGVTGHGNEAARMHLQSLERHAFDAVMLGYNYRQMQLLGYAAEFDRLAAHCKKNKVAIQTIQAIARGPKKKDAGKYNIFFYEPLVAPHAIEKSVHWALGLEGSFLITAGDTHFIPGILAAADRFTERPPDTDMEALVRSFHIQPVFK